MSDRVDTDAVRARIGDGCYVSPLLSKSILALCDELDRTREALREAVWHLHNGRDRQALDRLRAALASEGNTGRCPNGCENGWLTDPSWIRPMRCRHEWHRTTDTEGEK